MDGTGEVLMGQSLEEDVTNQRFVKVHTKLHPGKGKFFVVSLIVHDGDHEGRLL